MESLTLPARLDILQSREDVFVRGENMITYYNHKITKVSNGGKDQESTDIADGIIGNILDSQTSTVPLMVSSITVYDKDDCQSLF